MPGMRTRAHVVDTLAQRILLRAQGVAQHALRVAVTGMTASGKSTLTMELVKRLEALGRPSVRVPVDGFHNPQSMRYQRGRDSAEGYYRDAYNYDLLVKRVLIPLGPGGDGCYVARVFDLEADAPVEIEPTQAVEGSIVVLDASFLLRPELREHFDYRVFVQTSFEEAQARGVHRDQAVLGGRAEAERLYRQRYHAAQRLYFAEVHPLRFADALFINEDVDAPVLFVRP